jgi:hypothetical protein
VAITDEVKVALEELRATFPDSAVTYAESGNGGAWCRVEPVSLGDSFQQQDSWIIFEIPYLYPEADLYPFFVRPDLTRKDGGILGEGLAQPVGCWVAGEQQGTQVSRRTNILDSATNSAAGKLLKVLRWLGER